MALALLMLTIAVAAAIAWCIWLERHPEAPGDDGRDRNRGFRSRRQFRQ